MKKPLHPVCLHSNIKEQYDKGWKEMLSQNNIHEITKTDKPDADNAGQHHLVSVAGVQFLKKQGFTFKRFLAHSQ